MLALIITGAAVIFVLGFVLAVTADYDEADIFQNEVGDDD